MIQGRQARLFSCLESIKLVKCHSLVANRPSLNRLKYFPVLFYAPDFENGKTKKFYPESK